MEIILIIVIAVLVSKFKNAAKQPPKPVTRTTPANMQLREQTVRAQQTTSPQKNINVGIQEENRAAMAQVHAGRVEANTTTILERAKSNADEDKEDVTLHTMEAEHHHSERVAPAIHHHPEDDLTENVLGTVEDLMVKGFDGNLCFERDFVGEAMDMINRFTVPSEI